MLTNEYCYMCNKNVDCLIINNKHNKKILKCSVCGNEFYNEGIINYNVKLYNKQNKIYDVSDYIISKVDVITPLILQKLLYFIQGFSYVFLKHNIFEDNCEAWVNGPVYKDIYKKYSKYKYHNIDKKINNYNINLDDEEIKVIDAVIECFSNYNADVLMLMTHKTEPWIKNRIKLNHNQKSKNIINIKDINNYFSNIVKENDIKCLNDIN